MSTCYNAGIINRGRWSVINNNITVNNSLGTENHGGIELGSVTFSVSSNSSVMGNVCVDYQGTPTQDYGIWVQSGVTRANLVGNNLYTNQGTNLYDQGTSTGTAGNLTA